MTPHRSKYQSCGAIANPLEQKYLMKYLHVIFWENIEISFKIMTNIDTINYYSDFRASWSHLKMRTVLWYENERLKISFKIRDAIRAQSPLDCIVQTSLLTTYRRSNLLEHMKGTRQGSADYFQVKTNHTCLRKRFFGTRINTIIQR